MLSPQARTVAMELLRPPPGLRLDLAVLTTYTLDLEALLALPLAAMAHADGGVEKLLEDPLLLLQALREAGDRIHVFVDETGIAVPRRERELYATLEESVHPVRAPGGGVFHPKVWLARFTSGDERGETRLRLAVLSRNLTFDRSWDVALASEATPGRRRFASSGPLGRFTAELPKLCTTPLPRELAERVEGLSEEVARTAFPSPEGFSDVPIAFHTMGVGAPHVRRDRECSRILPASFEMQPKCQHSERSRTLGRSKRWAPKNGRNVLAVSPFVKGGALDAIRDLGRGERRLISRQEELDALSGAALTPWSEVRVLTDAVSDESDDESSRRPSGLHAKIVGVEHGWNVTWFVGSANLTNSALNGRNVEVMAEITGRKSRVGITKFLDGFDELCETYRASDEQSIEEEEDHAAEQVLERAVHAVVQADLQIACRPIEDLWEWRLDGRVALPDGVAVRVWPVSVSEYRAVPLEPPVSLALPMSRLTAFAAFHLTVDRASVEGKRLALKLPMHGVPEERTAQILRSLIDSPERLLAFLRALLGGLEGLPDMVDGDAIESGGAPWQSGLEAETLLEDMLRAASRDPERLETVRRLIADLRSTQEGRRIVPDGLYAVWRAVETALGPGESQR